MAPTSGAVSTKPASLRASVFSLLFFRASRRSINRTGGNTPPPTRSGSETSRNLPRSTLCQLSSAGVALPRTHNAPSWALRTTAMSRAWYLGASLCL